MLGATYRMHVVHGAAALAHEGIELARGDHPVPAVVGEVDDEAVATALRARCLRVTVHLLRAALATACFTLARLDRHVHSLWS